MKKLFITIILLMCCVTTAVLGASRAFSTIEDEGYAMPASAGISQALAADGSEPISLVAVTYDDVIYSTLTGYFVGEDRTKIDLTFPLYINGGTGVRFLGDENWLITSDVDVYQTFEGLYISEGVSYNKDMSQADEEEFIFIALPNGLYMNAQQAVFEGPLGSVVIPANSIISMTEDSIRWFGQKEGTLGYDSEEAVFGAYIIIGEHRYLYSDLLDALGLVRQAIAAGGGQKPVEELLQEAEEILNEKEEDSGKNPGRKPEIGEPGGCRDRR